MLGPLFRTDLLRAARRRRTFVVRTAYLLALFAAIVSAYALWRLEGPGRFLAAGAVPLFVAGLFGAFVALQFLLAALFAPAVAAAAVAEEKDRQTLDLLLTTDLTAAALVVGKAAPRLLRLVLLLLSALPLLALLTALGGLDVGLAAASVATTLLTVLSLGGVGAAAAVAARRSRDAVLLAYLVAAAYFALSGALWLVVRVLPAGRFFPLTSSATPLTPDDLVIGVNAGNAVTRTLDVVAQVRAGVALDAALWPALGGYALFHTTVTFLTFGWAAARLRTWARLQAERRQPKREESEGTSRRVWDAALLWKELTESPRLPRRLRQLLYAIVAGSFAYPALLLVVGFLIEPTTNGRTLPRDLGEYLSTVGTAVAAFLWLGVAVRAANGFSGERAAGTFDGLLTAPLRLRDLLTAKWLGAVLSVRRGLAWLGLLFLVGWVGGSFSAGRVVLLLALWFVFASAYAWVGLWCSAEETSPRRAMFKALLAVLLLSGGHWLVGGLVIHLPLELAMPQGDDTYRRVAEQELGLTPPYAYAALTGRMYHDLKPWGESRMEAPSARGAAVWLCLNPVLALMAGLRLRRHSRPVTEKGTACILPEKEGHSLLSSPGG